MRRTLTALALAVVLAGCGGGNDTTEPATSTATLPAVTDGQKLPVANQAEGDRECERYQQAKPAGVSQLTFDVPGTGADVTCIVQ